MMRNYSKTIGALAAASALVAGSASAAADFEGNIHIGANTDYIFRGTDQGDGMAEGGLDLSKEWNGLTLSGGLWYASIENSGFSSVVADHYSELDLYGEVSKDFGFATAYVGYIWYHYENTEVFGSKVIDDAQEIYFGLSRELFWGINGSLTYYWDIETDNQGYTELGLEKSFELHPCVSLDLASKLAYLVEEGDFSHWTTSATLNVKVTDTFTVSPYVAYSVELDDLSTYSHKHEHNYLFGGVKAAVSF